MDYTLDYIVKENNRYFAHLRELAPTGTSKEINTGAVYGWNGMTYKELANMLFKYGITLPPLKDLYLFKKTQYRKCYMIL